MARFPHVNAANRYARDVVAGRIPACKWAVLSCQRHLDDLKREKEKSWLYRFDKVKAERVCRFVEHLPHIKGKWRGQPFLLSPWQKFILCSVFG